MAEESKPGNPWGHYRAPLAKLKQVGNEVIHGEKSGNTVGDLQADYQVLFDEVRQIDHYISIKMKTQGSKPTADEIIKAFDGKTYCLFGDGSVTGYATHTDIEEFLASARPNFDFVRNLMAKRWNLKRSTIDSFLKPGRNKNKKG